MSKAEELQVYHKMVVDREQPYINKIVDFWARQGKVARISVIHGSRERGTRFHSNIINGMIK